MTKQERETLERLTDFDYAWYKENVLDKKAGEQVIDQNIDDPTHSQLAKDHPEHHLNTLAGELAVAAVYEVGVRMKSIWLNDGKHTLKDLENLIDKKYFRHPADIKWMEKLIVDWKNNNPNALTRARYRSEAAYKLALGQDALDKFSHDAHNLREDLKRKQKQIDDASKN